jgi:RimJ/RimL family protein N-acetyltransferase
MLTSVITTTVNRSESLLELLGEKVKLRPVDDSDIDDLYNWWNDPEFAGEYAGDYPKSRMEVEELVRGGWFYIISSRSDDKKIGFIAYYLIRRDYLNLFEIGYRIKPGERRKGYTTEAARLLVDYLFRTKKEIERIESVTDVENVPSQRVLEKNGFKREGELRKRFYNKGQYRNEYMYSLLREEWEKTKAQ